MTLESIIIEPDQTAEYAIIWLHGLGASGDDFVNIIPELNLPANLPTRFIFPHAPTRPVTLNMGMPMRAWYDIYGLSPQTRQDEAGIEASTQMLSALIHEENAKGIPSNRIILAGFSQGGALALHTGLHYPEKIAGVLALSTYLPLHESFGTKTEKANQATSIFMAHGTSDNVVPLSFGKFSMDALKTHHYSVSWHTYAMAHALCHDEICDIGVWIKATLIG